MPIVSGKSAGDQNVAKAGVNLVENFANVAANQVFNSEPLATPGLPKLTWLVTQTTGAVACAVTPQVAWRRGDIVGNIAALVFFPVSAAVLLVPQIPTVVEFNMPAEAMRLSFSTPVGLPAGTNITVVLMASG